MHFQPAHFPFGPQKRVFYRGQFVIWPRVLIIMMDQRINPAVYVEVLSEPVRLLLNVTQVRKWETSTGIELTIPGFDSPLLH